MIVLLKLISLYTGACSTSTPSRSQVARSCGCQESILLREYNTKLNQKVKELQQKLNGENSCHYPIKLQMGTLSFPLCFGEILCIPFIQNQIQKKLFFCCFFCFTDDSSNFTFWPQFPPKPCANLRKEDQPEQCSLRKLKVTYKISRQFLPKQKFTWAFKVCTLIVVTPQKQEMPSYSFDYRGRFDFFFSQPTQ